MASFYQLVVDVRTVTAQLSAARVQVDFHDAEAAAKTFSALWSASGTREYAPTLLDRKLEVRRTQQGFRIDRGGQLPAHVVRDESSICPLLELDMYELFLDAEQIARRAVLHAAAVVDGDTTYVLAGVSGAGKSAMSRAALAHGLQYYADEHVVTDGELIWGVPRAIHLDLESVDAPRRAWHEGADLDSYVFNGAEGRMRLPFVAVPSARLALAPQRLGDTVLVELQRSDANQVGSLSAAGRVKLVARSHFLTARALAEVAVVPLAYTVSWSDPLAAFGMLIDSSRRALRAKKTGAV